MRSARTLTVALLATALSFTALLPLPAPARAADFGANGMIVFDSTAGPHYSDIWVAQPDGSNAVDLTANQPGLHYEPTWSPEGGPHIGFVTAAAGGPGDIWWMTPAGMSLTRTTNTASFDERWPNFSPGGGHIVYSRSRWVDGKRGAGEIYESHLMGGPPHRLTFNQGDDITPAWSPDTYWIVFASDRGGGAYNLYMMLSQDGEMRTPAARIAGPGVDPQWAPDGHSVVYQSNGAVWSVAETKPGNPQERVYPRWGQPVQLTRGPNDSNPQWMPDQRPGAGRIVFQRGHRTWVMSADGTGEHVYPNLLAASMDPDVQPVCTVAGTDGNDVQRGTDGRDLICWSDGNDISYGGGGDDVIFGGSGHDVLYGGPGNDLIQGGGFRSVAGDTIYGGDGNDFLTGSPKDDYIVGGAGQDRLIGETGDDTLIATPDGGTDHDTLLGGPGQDVCVADKNDFIGPDCEKVTITPIPASPLGNVPHLKATG